MLIPQSDNLFWSILKAVVSKKNGSDSICCIAYQCFLWQISPLPQFLPSLLIAIWITKFVGGMFRCTVYKGFLSNWVCRLYVYSPGPCPNHCQMVDIVFPFGAIYKACGCIGESEVVGGGSSGGIWAPARLSFVVWECMKSENVQTRENGLPTIISYSITF